MSCQDCLDRRAFLARSALAAAALVAIDGCGDGQIGPTIPRTITPGPSVTVRLADFPDLATVGKVVDLTPAGAFDRALVRTGDATFVAFSRLCTHQQCVTDIRNNRFECPCHGSIFANDGSVIRGPNIASPPITPLHTVATTYDSVAGTVTVG